VSGGVVRRLVWPAVFAVAFVVVLVVAVFPTRTYLAQRASTAEAEARLAELEEQNHALERRIESLGEPEEIERLAREEFGLVMPGEEAYHILPLPADDVELPDVWPFERLNDRFER
jgi:cell division protein FtsB